MHAVPDQIHLATTRASKPLLSWSQYLVANYKSPAKPSASVDHVARVSMQCQTDQSSLREDAVNRRHLRSQQ